MARTWLSLRADLVEGHGERFWPRPAGSSSLLGATRSPSWLARSMTPSRGGTVPISTSSSWPTTCD